MIATTHPAVHFWNIKPERRYYVFKMNTFALSETTGQEFLNVLKEEYDYEYWLIDEERRASQKAEKLFLKYAQECEEEISDYYMVFEKKIPEKSKKVVKKK